MKKMAAVTASLLLTLTLSPVASSAAETRPEQITVDGIEYMLEGSGDAYRVTGVTDTKRTEIVLPAQIEGLDVVCMDNVFSQCLRLQEFSVEEGSRYLYTDDGVLFMDGYPGADHLLIAYPSAKADTVYHIPTGTDVSNNAPFISAVNLTEIYLPDQKGLNTVGQLTSRCSNLESVHGTMQTTGLWQIVDGNVKVLSLGGVCAPLSFSEKTYYSLASLQIQEDTRIEYPAEWLVKGTEQLAEQTVGEPAFSCSGTQVTTLRIPQVVNDRWMEWRYTQPGGTEPFGVTVSDCEELETLIIPYGAVRDGVKIVNCPKLHHVVVEERDDARDRLLALRKEAELPTDAYEDPAYEGTILIAGCPFVQEVEHTGEFDRLLVRLEASEIKAGDVNSDGSVNILDVICVNKALLGSTKLTDAQNAAADVDGDGDVTTTDSLNILKYVVEVIGSFEKL